ncbi:MAG TPA: hypothetical protein VEA60_07205 [Allosphingosinicella sp.]|nr:hypothetical protein [Allosphingosinicella sp.]
MGGDRIAAAEPAAGAVETKSASDDLVEPACAPGNLDCNPAAEGRGAFAKPSEMWVGTPAELVFAVAPEDKTIEAELGRRREAEEAESIAIGRCMRVTLEEHPAFEILTPNGEIRTLSRMGDRASWKWMVRPRESGSHDLRAKVEVMRMAGDDCTDRGYDYYKSEVRVRVEISSWKSLLRGLAEAQTVGDLFGALFQSWKTALVSLAALITAIGGVAAAMRGLRRRRGGTRARGRRAKR